MLGIDRQRETGQRVTLEQIRAFLEASDEVQFAGRDREQVYVWIARTLREQQWSALKRSSRSLVGRYLEKMTGLSRAQITRLIQLYTTLREARRATKPKGRVTAAVWDYGGRHAYASGVLGCGSGNRSKR